MSINLERMLQGYVECAEWADCGPDHETHSVDWSNELHRKMHDDCEAFIAACGETILDELAELAPGYSDEQFGHDFWLTRNGHGAGYWDRSALNVRIKGDLLGTLLTNLSRKAGECELFVGDDGLVYAI